MLANQRVQFDFKRGVIASAQFLPGEYAVQQVAAKVSINKADVDTLASLTGVGLAKAEAIIAYRKAHGGFKSIEQLAEVKGIGEATIAKNRSRLTL